jgi:hypothetical protein
VANLVEERRHADVFGPLLRDSVVKPDAGVQADQGVEVVEAVAEAKQSQPALDDVPGGDWLRRHEAAYIVERLRKARHRGERGDSTHAPAEQPDHHVAGAGARPRVLQRSDDVAALGEPVGGNSAVGCAAEAMVAQVVGEDVVPAVVQDFVVGHEVDLESVAARGPVPMPWLKVSGYAGPAEAQRMVGDDQLVRPWRRNEPGLKRHAVMRGERDVLVLEAVLGR